MKTITIILSFVKILPILIIGTANTVVYWLENAGLESIAQLTPTDRDNKAIVVIKEKANKLRLLGEKLNFWIKKLGV